MKTGKLPAMGKKYRMILSIGGIAAILPWVQEKYCFPVVLPEFSFVSP
jgi:hypothetical protein